MTAKATAIADPEFVKSIPKIYFDLTTSYHFTGHPTGIARVEQRAYQSMIHKFGVRIVPVVWNGDGFVVLTQSQTTTHPKISHVRDLVSRGSVQTLDVKEAPVGSHFIIVGGAWIRNIQYVKSVLLMRQNTISVALTLLVHDIIQMKLPHLYPEEQAQEFEINVKRMAAIADHFLCYSETSISDLTQLLIDTGNYPKPISKFTLGDMTDEIAEQLHETTATQTFKRRFTGKSFALYVSSIDARKNHILLINVWRRLVQRHGHDAPHLLLVGRPLARSEDVTNAISRDSSLADHVHLLPDVDDPSLDWLYRNCAFTVYPSLYEGWGLPVAESMSYGKLCIASDSTSTAEVAPDLTHLIDPYDFRAWLDAIEGYFSDPSSLTALEVEITQKYRKHPWQKSVEEIAEALTSVKPADSLPSIEALHLDDEPFDFSKAQEESLATALAMVTPTSRLPPTRTIFRLIRLTQLDRALMFAYRKAFARTNDSVRRVIEVLQSMPKR